MSKSSCNGTWKQTVLKEVVKLRYHIEVKVKEVKQGFIFLIENTGKVDKSMGLW